MAQTNWFDEFEAGLNGAAETDLGTIVAVLDSQGRYSEGDILAASKLRWRAAHDNWSPQQVAAILEVPAVYYGAVPDDLIELTYEVLRSIHRDGDDLSLTGIQTVPLMAGADWRRTRVTDRDAGTRGANQGVVGPDRWVRRDTLRLLDSEAPMYDALIRWQVAHPAPTIGIMPGCGMRVPSHTFWPDFVVTFRGRAAGIEIDGPHHARRYADDQSRDRLLEDAGLAFIERLAVELNTAVAELDTFVERFARKLGER